MTFSLFFSCSFVRKGVLFLFWREKVRLDESRAKLCVKSFFREQDMIKWGSSSDDDFFPLVRDFFIFIFWEWGLQRSSGSKGFG